MRCCDPIPKRKDPATEEEEARKVRAEKIKNRKKTPGQPKRTDS